MKFRNDDEGAMVRIQTAEGRFWKSVETGETIDLPEDKGFAYGFVPVESEEGSGASEEGFEETTVDESGFFEEELNDIKGIGSKTVRDLMEVYNSKKELLEDLKQGNHIPVRNDIEKKLKRHYENEIGELS